MVKDDFEAFVKMLNEAYDLIGSGQNKVISAGAKRLFFRTLELYPLEVISRALTAHCVDPKRGQFVPKPADIIFQIDQLSPGHAHLGSEEAWAICLLAVDDGETVVWTDEMAVAFEACRHILVRGDEVGARMAFKETYQRLILRAIKEHTAPQWFPSLGTDSDRRASALQRAGRAGRLAGPQIANCLPAPLVASEDVAKGISEGATRFRDVIRTLRSMLAHTAEHREVGRHEALRREREAMKTKKTQIETQVIEFKTRAAPRFTESGTLSARPVPLNECESGGSHG